MPGAEARDQPISGELAGSLWAAVRLSDGPHPATQNYRYFRGLFNPDFLNRLQLPTDADYPEVQHVTLEGRGDLQRPTADELAEAYRDNPRTRLYENLRAPWAVETISLLQKLARCAVSLAIYDSLPFEDNFGPHSDRWYLVAAQWRGVKQWWIGDDATKNKTIPPTITMKPGDVLCLPQGVMHDISTPDPIGSTHLAVAIVTERPIHLPESLPAQRKLH